MFEQTTIAEKVSCTGRGLHSGLPIQLTLRPARANHGIVFVRTDEPGSVELPARPASVSTTFHATTLSRGETRVATVEHLLAALYALGIDNARVELDGPEVPVMDGSAAPFVSLVRSAGVFKQSESRAILRIERPVEVVDGDRSILIEPARRFRISYAIEFDHPAIGRQEYRMLRFTSRLFEREIAPARTFGFLHDVSALWRAGLARGGSLSNTIVLDDRRVLNSGGLRCPDEFVRHKVLDLVGDLALLGLPIQGHVRVERGGHGLHQALVREILASPEAWRLLGDDAGFPHALDWVPVPSAVPAS